MSPQDIDLIVVAIPLSAEMRLLTILKRIWELPVDIRISGDTATSRAICFNPMVMGGDQGQIYFVGIWYVDEFVRTAQGWRMSKRVEEKCFDKIL